MTYHVLSPSMPIAFLPASCCMQFVPVAQGLMRNAVVLSVIRNSDWCSASADAGRAAHSLSTLQSERTVTRPTRISGSPDPVPHP